jgi:hypothetical protein
VKLFPVKLFQVRLFPVKQFQVRLFPAQGPPLRERRQGAEALSRQGRPVPGKIPPVESLPEKIPAKMDLPEEGPAKANQPVRTEPCRFAQALLLAAEHPRGALTRPCRSAPALLPEAEYPCGALTGPCCFVLAPIRKAEHPGREWTASRRNSPRQRRPAGKSAGNVLK